MCSRVCNLLSRGTAHIWNNLLVDDWKSVAENAKWVWDQLQAKQPDRTKPRPYTRTSGKTVVLLPLTSPHQIDYQNEVLHESQNWYKRMVKLLATNGGIAIFLFYPSISGTVVAVAFPYVCAKLAHKGIDMWHEKTETSNIADIESDLDAMIAQGRTPP